MISISIFYVLPLKELQFARRVKIPRFFSHKIYLFILMKCLLVFINIYLILDPQVVINPLKWRDDIVNIAVTGLILGCLICVAFVLLCWWTKSKQRQVQRLNRRNSIRQSLTSLRSLSLSQPAFSELSYRRKPVCKNYFNSIFILLLL